MCFMRVYAGTMIGPSCGELTGVPELVPRAGLSPPLCRLDWGQLTTPAPPVDRASPKPVLSSLAPGAGVGRVGTWCVPGSAAFVTAFMTLGTPVNSPYVYFLSTYHKSTFFFYTNLC